MRCRNGLLLFALLAVIGGNLKAQTDSLRLDLRWETSVAQDNTLDQTIIYAKGLLPNLDLHLGARIAETAFDLQSVSYKGELRYHFCPYFSANARAVVRNLVEDKVGTSTYLAYATVHSDLENSWGVYASAGWFERFTLFEGLPFYPRFSRDLPERDWIFIIGGNVPVMEEWNAALELSTLEAIEAMNLNNPFATLTVSYQPTNQPWRAFLYARYRILLGFGRLDAFLLGTALQFPL